MAQVVSGAARWLAWTLLYGVVANGLMYGADRPPFRRWTDRLLNVLGGWFVVIPAIPAFVIGLRFATWWWPLGPPLALIQPYQAVIGTARRRGTLAKVVGESPNVGVEGMAGIGFMVTVVIALVTAAAAFVAVAWARW